MSKTELCRRCGSPLIELFYDENTPSGMTFCLGGCPADNDTTGMVKKNE